MHSLAKLDHQYVWHPFTQMRDWLKREPLVLVQGRGALLQDVKGRTYLDANSSIWTNLHGHNHARINAAIRRQLGKIAHSSALGLANEPASLLARNLVQAANLPPSPTPSNLQKALGSLPKRFKAKGANQAAALQPTLGKVFFSDDGSTAIEVALKLAYEYARRSGRSSRPRFLCLDSAYHGDTIGAVSLGHIKLFHKAYANLLFRTGRAMSPYCYRCPFNRARPERADAREYRRCHWECLDKLDAKFKAQAKKGNPYAAFIFEPLMQGAGGMIPQPTGWLAAAAEIARAHKALLIADEVMTGFGRTGGYPVSERADAGQRQIDSKRRANRIGRRARPEGFRTSIFACHQENVQPDFLSLAKGLTGGYVPMAATLTTKSVFNAFLGDYSEFKTFFHGHSFTANQIGASAALANLKILASAHSIRSRRRLEQTLRQELKSLWAHRQVGDIRQVGLVVGVELVKDWRTREPFDLRDQVGFRICESMAKHGVLTRPIGNVIVLMPPYCTTDDQACAMVNALGQALAERF